MNISEIINELNKKLKEKYADFKGSYFYGSQALGDFEENSDIDIVGLFDNVNREKRMEMWDIIGEFEYRYNIFIDFHPMTEPELKRNSIYFNEVTKKGLFYGI
jgi:predicted nucleotidyltransferase